MRDANDRGYECLLLSDCTAVRPPSHRPFTSAPPAC